MDMIPENNSVMLCGNMAGAAHYSHTSRAQEFYTFPLEIPRLSGNCDVINIICRPSLLAAANVGEGDRVYVCGQLRTFNNRKGEGAKLVITVFARDIRLTQSDYGNSIALSGTLCKKPALRCTPMGRDICDLMLAVNRSYGRSDYIPCICWGSRARAAAEWDVGTKLDIDGRVQSRKYIKIIDETASEKTAYEVSVTEVREAAEQANNRYVNENMYTLL